MLVGKEAANLCLQLKERKWLIDSGEMTCKDISIKHGIMKVKCLVKNVCCDGSSQDNDETVQGITDSKMNEPNYVIIAKANINDGSKVGYQQKL